MKGLELAPSTVGVLHGIVSTVMRSAIRDRRIVSNPCEGTNLPKVTRKQIVPLTTEQADALRDALPPQLGALVTRAAGTGMRQGECFGLTVDRVRFLERTLMVDRQLVTLPGQGSTLSPPKTGASNRTIPLPQVVVDALAAHLAEFPAGPDGLVFTRSGKPITGSAFGHRWRSAVKTAGLPARTGFHALRHYYASLLIRHGESVKTVQARLGHASAVETLDTYSHLWPDSDDRTRDAIDSVLGSTADALRTGTAPTTQPCRSELPLVVLRSRHTGSGPSPGGRTVKRQRHRRAAPSWHCRPVLVLIRRLNELRQGLWRDVPIACQPSDPTQLGPASRFLCIGTPWSESLTWEVPCVPVLTSQWLAPETAWA